MALVVPNRKEDLREEEAKQGRLTCTMIAIAMATHLPSQMQTSQNQSPSDHTGRACANQRPAGNWRQKVSWGKETYKESVIPCGDHRLDQPHLLDHVSSLDALYP